MSYPNGDRLGRVMPEGHWSLSTLPANRFLVRVGLEASLWFLPGPALNHSYVGLDLSLNMIYVGADEVESFPSWSSFSFPHSGGSLCAYVCQIIFSFCAVYFGDVWKSGTGVRPKHLFQTRHSVCSTRACVLVRGGDEVILLHHLFWFPQSKCDP